MTLKTCLLLLSLMSAKKPVEEVKPFFFQMNHSCQMLMQPSPTPTPNP